MYEEAIKEAKEANVKNIKVIDEEVIYPESRGTKPKEEDWRVVDEEPKPTRILQKGPSQHRVLFSDGSERKIPKDDLTIKYL